MDKLLLVRNKIREIQEKSDDYGAVVFFGDKEGNSSYTLMDENNTDKVVKILDGEECVSFFTIRQLGDDLAFKTREGKLHYSKKEKR
jgi:hypothetical protein